MQVKDALLTGNLAEGTIIAGQEGLSRVIRSIEVMEVPEVVSWVTPGILVMTTFYSVKEEPLKQINIVQTLIDKNAAGIVVKLGRFVDVIPEEILTLANENAFPIITLPKHISYINVLTPLYERLYKEKQIEEENSHNPFSALEETNISTVSDAVEKLSQIAGSSVYIEDSEGRLLYVSNDFHADGWRKSTSLFSKPSYLSYHKLLEMWRMEFLEKGHSIFKIQGFRDRLVLPLITRGKVFAVVHILYTGQSRVNEIAAAHTKRVSSKLGELFMSEQLYLQKKRLDDIKQMERFLNNVEKQNNKRVISIFHFHANWLEMPFSPSLYVIDHSCFIRKTINHLIDKLTDSEIIVFEKYHNFYALVSCSRTHYSELLRKLNEIVDQHNTRNPADQLKVAINSGIKDAKLLEDSIHSVTKIMEIGCKVRPMENIYTHDQLGIYEILIKLTADPFVQNYTENVLHPLLQTQNGELIKTLQVYLNENGNVSKTAEILFVHRRTLTYRLQKIHKLINMDLNDAKNRFILRFCLMIIDLS
ncbi:PucR family transcriptional regulator [Lentibacillus sp. N15]|uniref:PucR family transcriptional regulator n=1 Tax=Lentibacillus songyuanensis TaxID=3136161 RepID=UPI0031BAD064